MRFDRWSLVVLILGLYGWLQGATVGQLSSAKAADDVGEAGTEIVELRKQMIRRIDEHLAELWEQRGIVPASSGSDGEFLRRAYLDLNGVIPRVSEVRSFLADRRPDKQRLLVDRLLESPRYASHMATVWQNRILPYEIEMQHVREAIGLHQWLRSRFARNLRYDNLVEGLLLATGEEELGPGLYYRALDLAPEKIAASAAELFLGLHLQCAQCHDHPYANWSQRDFWGFAAFFARVRSPEDRMMRTSYRLFDDDRGEVLLPDTEEVIYPKYLQASLAADDKSQTRRMQLTLWMTSRDNRLFVRAAVDWAWSHLFGRGLVPSLDHVGDLALSDHSELLEELAEYFVRSGFDLQELFRVLASTRAYQLSGQYVSEGTSPPELFARMLAKPLTPEQLYDSFLVLSPSLKGEEQRYGPQAEQATGGMTIDPTRMEFVRRMRSPPGDATEYRSGTLQALMLMNGELMDRLTAADRSSLLGALAAPYLDDEQQIEAVFLAALARSPTPAQQAQCVEMLRACETSEERTSALGDILWALANSTEFGFNR
ncbi:MAG: DUF1549 domain-containing protein [Planctomycetales bacterium]|nr:DUF1549 domain-containing protein [Planctomycetales bacterium]